VIIETIIVIAKYFPSVKTQDTPLEFKVIRIKFFCFSNTNYCSKRPPKWPKRKRKKFQKYLFYLKGPKFAVLKFKVLHIIYSDEVFIPFSRLQPEQIRETNGFNNKAKDDREIGIS